MHGDNSPVLSAACDGSLTCFEPPWILPPGQASCFLWDSEVLQAAGEVGCHDTQYEVFVSCPKNSKILPCDVIYSHRQGPRDWSKWCALDDVNLLVHGLPSKKPSDKTRTLASHQQWLDWIRTTLATNEKHTNDLPTDSLKHYGLQVLKPRLTRNIMKHHIASRNINTASFQKNYHRNQPMGSIAPHAPLGFPNSGTKWPCFRSATCVGRSLTPPWWKGNPLLRQSWGRRKEISIIHVCIIDICVQLYISI